MYLLEHDAKTLLAARGIPVPAGALVTPDTCLLPGELPPGPWIVKAQVAAGGRGKAGLVRKVETVGDVEAAAADMFGVEHRGRRVAACRVEQCVPFTGELYTAFLIDPESGGVRVLASAAGGVDIEEAGAGGLLSEVAAPDAAALQSAVTRIAARLPDPAAAAIRSAGPMLADAFLAHEAMLLEINPLFLRADGTWIAGDAKMVLDGNAIERQPAVVDLLKARGRAYPETHLKWEHGCDYVVVDPEGDIGLLTTGAGLSMMLIDELRGAGMRPYNFLDVRTGGLRGDPARLVHVLRWIAEGRNVRVILVNVFAGITHLGEFSRLLLEAIRRVPELRVPVVTRLVGNGLDDARAVLGAAGIAVEPDLGKAIALVRGHLR